MGLQSAAFSRSAGCSPDASVALARDTRRDASHSQSGRVNPDAYPLTPSPLLPAQREGTSYHGTRSHRDNMMWIFLLKICVAGSGHVNWPMIATINTILHMKLQRYNIRCA